MKKYIVCGLLCLSLIFFTLNCSQSITGPSEEIVPNNDTNEPIPEYVPEVDSDKSAVIKIQSEHNGALPGVQIRNLLS